MSRPGDKNPVPLTYEAPRWRRALVEWRAIPVWKHVVFVPLLFWVGLFLVGAVIVAALALFEVLWRWVTQ